MTLYEQLLARTELPTVTCDDVVYVLVGLVARTGRVFAGCREEAHPGEKYTDEWEAIAIGPDSERYIVRWQFTRTKGREGPADELPWDVAESVRLA